MGGTSLDWVRTRERCRITRVLMRSIRLHFDDADEKQIITLALFSRAFILAIGCLTHAIIPCYDSSSAIGFAATSKTVVDRVVYKVKFTGFFYKFYFIV